MTVEQFSHAKLLQDLTRSGATLEDLARAYASIDGKRDYFDAGKGKSVWYDETGHYAGYMAEMEAILKRATQYADDRKAV